MVGSIGNGSVAMQQMHQMRKGQGMGQGSGPKGHGLGQLMQSLPDDYRTDLQQTLQSMDETQRKDVVSQLKELDVSTLSQDELMNKIQNILNPTTTAIDNTFLTYA